MHIHNFLVDYRNKHSVPTIDKTNKREICVDDMCDNTIFNMVINNDNNRGEGGRPSNEEKQRRINGVRLRDELKLALVHANMHRRRKKDNWNYDASNHIIDKSE